MSSIEPSCVARYRSLSYKKRSTTVKNGEPLFDLLMRAAMDKLSRMQVVLRPRHLFFDANAFKPAAAYFLPGSEAFEHYRPVAASPAALEYLKMGDRLVCRYGGTKESSQCDIQVFIYFTCPSIHSLERKELGVAARKPRKGGKSALEKTL